MGGSYNGIISRLHREDEGSTPSLSTNLCVGNSTARLLPCHGRLCGFESRLTRQSCTLHPIGRVSGCNPEVG